MEPKRVILAGGSGFLGRSLSGELAAGGYDVVILTRSPGAGGGAAVAAPVRKVAWDGKTVGDWAAEFEGAAAVVNLAGKNVNCRYTPENRREIVASRIGSVEAVGRACAACAQVFRLDGRARLRQS